MTGEARVLRLGLRLRLRQRGRGRGIGLGTRTQWPQVGHKRLLPSSPQYHYRLTEGIVTQSSASFNDQNASSPTGTASTRKLTIRHLCLCTCRSTLLPFLRHPQDPQRCQQSRIPSSSTVHSTDPRFHIPRRYLPFLRHPQDPQRCQQILNSLVIHRFTLTIVLIHRLHPH